MSSLKGQQPIKVGIIDFFTLGDLGNVEASADGVAALDIKDSLFSLSGDRSIIGE